MCVPDIHDSGANPSICAVTVCLGASWISHISLPGPEVAPKLIPGEAGRCFVQHTEIRAMCHPERLDAMKCCWTCMV